jgi:regulatory protein
MNEHDLARLKALKLLSYSARSEKGLYQRLRDAGYGNDAAQFAVSCMIEQGFVDDEKMAADYVAFAVERKAFGRYRVVQELVNKGINKDTAESAYESYVEEHAADEDYCGIDLDNAAAALEKRMRQTGLDSDELDEGDMRRLTGYLYRRGFSFEVIRQAFERVKK